MSNAVQTIQEQKFTPEQMALITSTIAKNASPDELKLFLYRCQHMGLDPLKPGQIHFIKYGSGAGTIVVGIEGFRAKAGRTGKMSGIKRGVIRNDKGECVGGWAEVYRSDWKEPAREEVPLAEYFKPGKPGYPSNWEKMPETMIKKVAEAAALRMAFPDDLGGIYTSEEMEQAEQQTRVRDDLRENGNTDPRPGILQFGYFTQKSCAEVERNEGRDALEREHERLSNHKDPRGQQAYHMIDEYLRMYAPGEALEAEEAPEEPQAKAHPVCVCGSAFVKSKTKPTYYCPNFKAQGEHSRNIPADQVEG